MSKANSIGVVQLVPVTTIFKPERDSKQFCKVKSLETVLGENLLSTMGKKSFSCSKSLTHEHSPTRTYQQKYHLEIRTQSLYHQQGATTNKSLFTFWTTTSIVVIRTTTISLTNTTTSKFRTLSATDFKISLSSISLFWKIPSCWLLEILASLYWDAYIKQPQILGS